MLPPGVNLTNILRADFSYASFLRSFYVLTIWVCNIVLKGFWHKNVGEIDTWRQKLAADFPIIKQNSCKGATPSFGGIQHFR